MDTNQILLISAITVMTILITLVGFQLFLVLKEIRKLLIRANTIMSELEKIGVSAEHSYTELVGFLSGMKNIFYIVDLLAKKKKKHDKR